MHAPRQQIFEKKYYLRFFIKVYSLQSLIENSLGFILF